MIPVAVGLAVFGLCVLFGLKELARAVARIHVSQINRNAVETKGRVDVAHANQVDSIGLKIGEGASHCSVTNSQFTSPPIVVRQSKKRPEVR